MTKRVLNHHLQPGTILNGRYLIEAIIGEGGFGITYIGKDQVLNMTVAIKEYFPKSQVTRSTKYDENVICQDPEKFQKGKEKFLGEARVLAGICGEPGIVEVHNYFEANNTAYIIMEYVDGVSLNEYVKAHHKIPEKELKEWFLPLLKSLQIVHEKGLIHRDISPDNIMLTKQGQLKLIDFGAARKLKEQRTQTMSVYYKPDYSPEEQYREKGHHGPWTDIYSVCATMYKCLTGISPTNSLDRLREDDVIKPSDLGIAVSPVFERMIMRGMSVKQEDRFQSVSEMLDFLADDGKTQKKRKRTRLIVAILCIALIAGILVTTVPSYMKNHEETTTEAKASTWDSIQKNGTIRVAVLGTKKKDGIHVSKYKRDTVNQVCDEMGLKCKLVKGEIDDPYALLNSGKADVVFMGFEYQSDDSEYTLSSTIYKFPVQVIIRKSNQKWATGNIQNKLASKKFACEKGSKAYRAFKNTKAWKNAKLTQCDDVDECMKLLHKKKVQVVLCDQSTDVSDYLKRYKLMKVENVGVYTGMGFVCKKDSDVVEQMNTYIEKMVSEDAFSNIIEKNQFTVIN